MSNAPYPSGVSEKIDFPIAAIVPNVRLYKVEPFESSKGNTGIAFNYIYTEGEKVSFLKDVRWKPRDDDEQKQLTRCLEHIAQCFVDLPTLYQEIEATTSFEEYVKMYAEALTNHLSNNRSLELKIVPKKWNGKWFANVGKYPPFVRARGEDVQLAYSDYETRMYNEWKTATEEAQEEIDFDPPTSEGEDDLPF